MKFDIRDRQEGKTTDLIEAVMRCPRANIVVPDRSQVRGMEFLLDQRFHGWKFWKEHYAVITFDDLLQGRSGRGRQEGDLPVFVDNIDMCLERFNIRLVTARGEEHERNASSA